MTTEKDLHEKNLTLHKINQEISRELAGSIERAASQIIEVLKEQRKDIDNLKFRVDFLERKERLKRESERLKIVH